MNTPATAQPQQSNPGMSPEENELRTKAGQSGVFGTERCSELLTQANALSLPTYGEKAVGLSVINNGGNPAVNACKQSFASIIDNLNELRASTDPEAVRLASVAITQAQTAQMWAVKAITWSA